MAKSTDNWPLNMVFGAMVISALVAIWLWYVALFLLAALLFGVIWYAVKRQHTKTRNVLVFRPGTIIPAEVWKETEGLQVVPGPDPVEITLVELDKYRDNWEKVRNLAQVSRADDVYLNGYLIAYKTPTADHGVVLAYDRMVLGEIRRIELHHFFDYIWGRGGIFLVPCQFRFTSQGEIQQATATLAMFLGEREGILPPQEKAAFSLLWRAVRGKRAG